MKNLIKIPRNIFQTWETKNLSTGFKSLTQSWKDNNPNYAYFLYDGPVHTVANLIELLKGFSIFKKKIGSNMKLVLSGAQGKYSAPLLQSLETYKYRNEVVLTGNLSSEKRIELLSSAYALIHCCMWERFGMPVPLAMKAGVAVLVPEHSVHSEMAGMAGMFFNEKDPADIGEKIIRIYRDEQMRTEMIGTGLQRIKSWE